MEITFTPEIEAFLKARFETEDIQPFVEKYLNDWVSHMVDVAYTRVPVDKLQAATADIIAKNEEAKTKKLK